MLQLKKKTISLEAWRSSHLEGFFPPLKRKGMYLTLTNTDSTPLVREVERFSLHLCYFKYYQKTILYNHTGISVFPNEILKATESHTHYYNGSGSKKLCQGEIMSNSIDPNQSMINAKKG